MEMSMYSAVFGALSNEQRLNVSANNLANVNTTGYKRDRLTFQDTFLRFAHDWHGDARQSIRDKQLLPAAQVIAKPRLAMETVDFEQGALQVTGSPMDIAIQGPGFFKVRSPGGDLYTRSGAFQRTAEGQLTTAQGYQVLGGGGAVDVPAGRAMTIDETGQIYVDGAPVGQIDVVTVDNPDEVLGKFGNNLFVAKNGAQVREGAPDPVETRVLQGYLEKPNVEVVEEMVAMIETQRVFEAYQKIMTGSNELDAKAVRVGTDR